MAKKPVLPKNGFSTTFLKNLKPLDYKYELSDQGLTINVYTTGQKTFIWKYKKRISPTKRTSQTHTIGDFIPQYRKDVEINQDTNEITLADARKKLIELKALNKARKLLTASEQEKKEKEESEAEQKLKAKLGQVIENFYQTLKATIRRPEAPRQLIDAEILGQRKDHYGNICHEGIILGDLILRNVTSQDVQELINNTIRRGKSEHAMKILALLKQFFGWCENGNHIDRSPIDKLNRKYFGVTPTREEHIFDIAPEEEGGEPIAGLPEIVNFFHTLDNTLRLSIQVRNGLKILLLTGIRTGELLKAKKGSIKGNNWHIPKENTKTLEAWTVPLSNYALSLFQELESNSDDNYYMSSIDSKAMARAVNRMVKQHEWPKFTPHTLRKVFRTHIEFMGVPSRVAEKCLNHSLGKIEGTYNKAKMLDRRREVLNKWSAKVELALHPENNVIQLKVS